MNQSIKNALRPMALEMLKKPVFNSQQTNIQKKQVEQQLYGQPLNPFQHVASSLSALKSTVDFHPTTSFESQNSDQRKGLKKPQQNVSASSAEASPQTSTNASAKRESKLPPPRDVKPFIPTTFDAQSQVFSAASVYDPSQQQNTEFDVESMYNGQEWDVDQDHDGGYNGREDYAKAAYNDFNVFSQQKDGFYNRIPQFVPSQHAMNATQGKHTSQRVRRQKQREEDAKTTLGDGDMSELSYFPTDLDIVPVKPRKVVASVSDFQQKFKTEICRNWEMSKCPFGSECTFAHGEHELLQKHHLHHNYRTKQCINFWSKLYCTYGSRCQFYHEDVPDHLKPKKKESYTKTLDHMKSYFSEVQNQYDLDSSQHSDEETLSQMKSVTHDKLIKGIQMIAANQGSEERLSVFEQARIGKKFKPENSGGILSGPVKKAPSTRKNYQVGINQAKNKKPFSSAASAYNYQPSHSTSKRSTTFCGDGSGQKKVGGESGKTGSRMTNSLFITQPATGLLAQETRSVAPQPVTGIYDALSQPSMVSQLIPEGESPRNGEPPNLQAPVPGLPRIHQYFPDLSTQNRKTSIMNEIKELMNETDQPLMGRDRTNSDNWTQQQIANEIEEELSKPSNQLVTSFTENMVYTQPIFGKQKSKDLQYQ